jgi:hypothetical protein
MNLARVRLSRLLYGRSSGTREPTHGSRVVSSGENHPSFLSLLKRLKPCLCTCDFCVQKHQMFFLTIMKIMMYKQTILLLRAVNAIDAAVGIIEAVTHRE